MRKIFTILGNVFAGIAKVIYGLIKVAIGIALFLFIAVFRETNDSL